jgi:hypothetical protein
MAASANCSVERSHNTYLYTRDLQIPHCGDLCGDKGSLLLWTSLLLPSSGQNSW